MRLFLYLFCIFISSLSCFGSDNGAEVYIMDDNANIVQSGGSCGACEQCKYEYEEGVDPWCKVVTTFYSDRYRLGLLSRVVMENKFTYFKDTGSICYVTDVHRDEIAGDLGCEIVRAIRCREIGAGWQDEYFDFFPEILKADVRDCLLHEQEMDVEI